MTRSHRPLLALAAAVPAAVLALTLAPVATAAPVAPSAPASRVVPAYPPGTIAYAQINTTVFHPGDPVTVTVHNTTPGPAVMALVDPARTLAKGRVVRPGTGTLNGAVPRRYPLGPASIKVTGNGGEVFVFQVTIVAA